MLESLSTKELIGYSAGLISFVNMFRYMYTVTRSDTRPSLAYWIIAEIAMILIALSSWATGDRTSLWIAVAYATTQLIIIALVIKKGQRDIKKTDSLLITISLLSIIVWYITNNPLYALVINVGIDAIGYIPLFRDIWKDPSREDTLYWSIAACACILNMFSVREISFGAVLYPWYLGIINTLVIFTLLYRSKKRTIQKSL